ncbi:sugar-binding domain-containing protein [Rhodanobacter sp. 115]|uniref:sugar-binding domain-containing protein n=1 Tax=Rhodanobacter sp. FW021-MT20 TaxID=1162282 RepID=UPI000260C9B2|nr:sugar-binding domain-containing protein [Rhodanobacter sp. 115]EIL96513.1 glycoside hydrolase family protein [Rhodanobacter sp. 115]
MLNLNGLWQYAATDGKAAPPFGKTLAGKVLVPYPIESVLSGVQKHADFMFYRRLVTIPAGFTAHGQHVRLNFGAVDREATVYVNGKQVAHHVGGYTSFSADITPELRAHGPQEIVVAVHAPVDGANVMIGKQRLKPSGIFYTAASGIWQTAWLEPVRATSLAQLTFTPARSLDAFIVTARVHGDERAAMLHVTAYADGKAVGEASGRPTSRCTWPSRIRTCGARAIHSCTPSRPRSTRAGRATTRPATPACAASPLPRWVGAIASC